jgi:hypothetical protein
MYEKVFNQLQQKYKKTGKIGFITPVNEEQALKLIKVLTEVYLTDKENK